MFIRQLPWRRLGSFHHRLPRYTSTISSPAKPPPPPSIKTCPDPTCPCSPTPSMPAGLPIDHKAPLYGTMSRYNEQVLVCTGKHDWESKIEDEDGGNNLAADLRGFFKKGGKYYDPYHNVSILNTSLPSITIESHDNPSVSAYLFPSFTYIPYLLRDKRAEEGLVEGYILPEVLHGKHDEMGTSAEERKNLMRRQERRAELESMEVNDVVVLICGHGGRDGRCGVMGPILVQEFGKQLPRNGYKVLGEEVQAVDEKEVVDTTNSTERAVQNRTATVGIVSHIGGHKFAGNVILYIPPGTKTENGEQSPLAGCGIWYGRVEPKHVEGIVRETIQNGRVVEELFRGGIRKDGTFLELER